MKNWYIILPVLLILTACSSTRLKEVERSNTMEHDSMKSSMQQYQAADSLKLEQLQRDIIQHRQSLLKTNIDIDVLNRQLGSLLNSPQLTIKEEDIDSLKVHVIDLQSQLAAQSDMLKFTSDRMTTILEDALDNSNRVLSLEKEVANIKQNFDKLDKSRDANKGNSAYQTISSLEAALASTQTNVKDLQNHLADISIQLQALISDPNVKPNPNVKPESYQKQMDEFRTQLNDLKEYIKTLDSQVNASRIQRDRTTAEQPLVKIEKPKMEVQPKPKVVAKPPVNPDAEAKALYDKARDLYESRKLDKAEVAFRDFLKQFPSHELAPNAQYWLGETFFAANEYERSITELQKVITDYVSAAKAPDAQYKIGMSYFKLGNNARGKAELEKIYQAYPDYERMSLVDKQLKSMK